MNSAVLKKAQKAIKLLNEGKMSGTQDLSEQVLGSNLNQFDALLGLGNIAHCQNAYNFSSGAIQVNSESEKAWFSLGNLHCQRKQWLKATEAYLEAVALQPNISVLYHNLGYTLQKLKRWSEAVACYPKTLYFKPDWVEVEVSLKNVLHTVGKLSDSEKPKYAALNNDLGMKRLQAKDLESAETYFRQAISLGPRLWSHHLNLGQVLFAKKNLKEAALSLKKVLALNPDCKPASQLLSRLYEASSDLAALPVPTPDLADSNVDQTSSSPSKTVTTETKSETELIGKVSTAIWKWAKIGLATADEGTFHRRHDICMQCPNWRDAPKTVLYQPITGNTPNEKICSLCGCVVSKKPWLASETFPDQHPIKPGLNRWEEPLQNNSQKKG
jgi:tetratricopeptide (TPR) repeat protein